ncbi:unnamed protein product [Polarella glacialis]|uniref:Uncharacterized protein n=1 Tax=Polarella glacialis TaxID=89957 RepID=A0A813DPG8_POLGL|nr:unnamed protein product [Polarella glacialis]CAE8697081.1 unnamed protein product [Polarella glacialis]
MFTFEFPLLWLAVHQVAASSGDVNGSDLSHSVLVATSDDAEPRQSIGSSKPDLSKMMLSQQVGHFELMGTRSCDSLFFQTVQDNSFLANAGLNVSMPSLEEGSAEILGGVDLIMDAQMREPSFFYSPGAVTLEDCAEIAAGVVDHHVLGFRWGSPGPMSLDFAGINRSDPTNFTETLRGIPSDNFGCAIYVREDLNGFLDADNFRCGHASTKCDQLGLHFTFQNKSEIPGGQSMCCHQRLYTGYPPLDDVGQLWFAYSRRSRETCIMDDKASLDYFGQQVLYLSVGVGLFFVQYFVAIGCLCSGSSEGALFITYWYNNFWSGVLAVMYVKISDGLSGHGLIGDDPVWSRVREFGLSFVFSNIFFDIPMGLFALCSSKGAVHASQLVLNLFWGIGFLVVAYQFSVQALGVHYVGHHPILMAIPVFLSNCAKKIINTRLMSLMSGGGLLE